MQNASEFFRSIHNQYSKLLDRKKEVAVVLEEVLGVPIDETMFTIKDSLVVINPNPFLKSKISLRREEIEKRLSNLFQKKITLR